MEKELRRRAKLQKLDESARQQAIKEWEETRDKRKNHKQMKHPVSIGCHGNEKFYDFSFLWR